MKMNKYVMAVIGLCMMAPALSQAAREHNRPVIPDVSEVIVDEVIAARPGNSPKECAQINLDDAQKSALKAAKFDYHKQRNTLIAAERNAQMDFARTLSDAKATRDQALAAASAAKDAMMATRQAKTDFSIKIFMDILKPEQRAPAMTCIAKMHRNERGHRDDRRH